MSRISQFSTMVRKLPRAARKVIAMPKSEEVIAKQAGELWSESTEDEFIREMSHWRGNGRYKNDEFWKSVGKSHLGMTTAFCRAEDRPLQFESMLEWGPGGGSNLVAFSPYATSLYGVDISGPNLEECGRQLTSEGHNDFTPIHIDPQNVEDVATQIRQPLDFFLTTAVIQHMPSKNYGLRVCKTAYEMLKPGGMALIQTRYDDGTRRNRPKNRAYRENYIVFTSYRIEEFWKNLEEIGFTPKTVQLNIEDRYAFYLVTK